MKTAAARRRFFIYVKNQKNLILVKILLTCILLCAAAVLIDARFRPVVRDMAAAQARYAAVQSINGAILSEVRDNAGAYSDLVILEKGNDNRVTALRTDVLKINQLRADVASLVLNSITGIDKKQVGVPMGNIMGSDLFSGRGPTIPVRLVPVGTVDTRFISVFNSAGINQTRHQIIMEITAGINVLLPGGAVYTEVVADLTVAETILVGHVPDSYTYIDDTESNLLSKINDYGEGDQTHR